MLAPLALMWLQSTDQPLAEWALPAFRQTIESARVVSEAQPVVVAGQRFTSGIATHACSFATFDLGKRAESFTATVGGSGASSAATVEYIVLTDGKEAWRSGIMRSGDPAKAVQVPLAGVARLALRVTDAGDGIAGDEAAWGAATLKMLRGSATPIAPRTERPYSLTPGAPKEPRLTGPTVVGTRPGSQFVHRLTATGQAPITFGASELPPGLAIDSRTGALTGSIGFPGSFRIRVAASNKLGTTTGELRIVVGDTLALTPPMGWIGQAGAQEQATAMAAKLAQHGWTYIVTPDSAAVADAIRGLGLRVGTTTTDAVPERIDLVWSDAFEPSLAERLRASGRDVVYGVRGPVAVDAAAAVSKSANMVRTNRVAETWPDLAAAWRAVQSWAPLMSPGHWIDPGPLVVGDPRFTPNEQYSQMTMWCLLAVPLLVTADLTRIDDEALSILRNDEVIELGQDPAGRPASLTFAAGDFEVWTKQMEDRSVVIGVFNLGETEADATLDFGDPKVRGGIKLRDLWRQEERRMKRNILPITVDRHGVLLLRTNKFVDVRFRLGHDPKPPKGGGQ